MSKNVEEMREHLNQAFTMISAIPVKEEQVEIMAAAKEHLRRAYALTKEETETTDG